MARADPDVADEDVVVAYLLPRGIANDHLLTGRVGGQGIEFDLPAPILVRRGFVCLTGEVYRDLGTRLVPPPDRRRQIPLKHHVAIENLWRAELGIKSLGGQ